MLCARPIPDSSMPPHHTGICLDWHRSWIRRAGVYPPTRPELDIDDAAGAEFDGCTGMLLGVDALIEANRGVEPALQFHVAENIVPPERLLDHHQVVGFQALQVRPVFQAVGGIGVHHQTDPRKLQAQPLDGRDVVSRLYLDLDALVARGQLAFDGGDSSSSVSLIPMETPQGISWRTPPAASKAECPFVLASASQRAASTAPLAMLCPRIGSRASHTSAALVKFPPLEERPDEIAQNKPRCLDGFRRVEGTFPGDAFAPSGDAVGSASTSNMRRSVTRPKLVSKGVTRGILISRRVIF